MLLYCPVGVAELRLIEQSDWRAFPPRRAAQPIFHPVLNLDYAVHIARDKNAKDPDSGFAGFVTRFEIDDHYAAHLTTQTSDSNGTHDEFWLAADELDEFNRHIVSPIAVVANYYGENFEGEPHKFPVRENLS